MEGVSRLDQLLMSVEHGSAHHGTKSFKNILKFGFQIVHKRKTTRKVNM